MGDARTVLTQMYAAFNRRDVAGVLAWMCEDVDWPKASEGGRVRGKEEVRAYWMRQWAEFDPTVEPVMMREDGAGAVEVEVRQVVRDREGAVLFDGVVWHVYAMRDGLIARMDVRDGEGAFRRQLGTGVAE